ncbi:uncharacterized protein EKO05_0002794 [Ascochyta rabiei]|uniref:uncharacterized protein n=1 Tax=Didymella rabiei TaxID=5454 RepID=UPI0018FFBDC1|nr:uncharacterized protein EKO05_0002794 [Ascochyta rabiei]UPX12237.1 hypothetical protein EKO05_0002794 [Ascochyta rabiei]
MTFLKYPLFWNFKKPGDNDWHPRVGQGAARNVDTLPGFLQRTDLTATLVDAAPFVAGVGAFRHASQMFDFGFTAHANVFRNPKTMNSMHRSVVFFVPLTLVLQGAGVEYRTLIPRWCHERERQRNEDEVRQHVDAGAYLGSLSWVVRMAFKVGVRYWAPIDVVLGGALSDVLHREYNRTHDF